MSVVKATASQKVQVLQRGKKKCMQICRNKLKWYIIENWK